MGDGKDPLQPFPGFRRSDVNTIMLSRVEVHRLYLPSGYALSGEENGFNTRQICLDRR